MADLSLSWAPPRIDSSSLSRQQHHLEERLQKFLDAQSEGLLSGLGRAETQQDDTSSTGTITPTSTTPSSFQRPLAEHVIPVRQPKARKLGLRSARRGISRTISELAALKAEEVSLLGDEARKRDDVLSTIEGFTNQEEALQSQIGSIKDGTSSREAESMKQEEGVLAQEIHDLETRLYEMKARHRLLKIQVEEKNNGIQARLSSYQNSLELARRDIKTFLARKPLGLEGDEELSAKGGFWSLPRDRRTLKLAEDHYRESQERQGQRLLAIQRERTALEEGGAIWQNVIQEVSIVEDALKEEMEVLAEPGLSAHRGVQRRREAGMRRILEKLKSTRTNLEEKLAFAEAKGWTLMVCCIGAEIEALREGHDVLEGALTGTAKQDTSSDSESGSHGSETRSDFVHDLQERPDSPQKALLLGGNSDSDDNPGPEFLVFHDDNL